MPMLTTVVMRSPVAPRHSPAADLVGEAGHAVEDLVHVGDDVVAVGGDDLVAGGPQGHVEDGPVLGDVDVLAGPHGVDALAQARPARRRRRGGGWSRAVRRFLE